MNRIYHPSDLSENQTITLEKTASNHVVNVLRLRVGNELVVFNGQGGEYLAELVTAGRQAEVLLKQFCDIKREPAISVHLGQCLSRGERMDYAIQKAVEVGVAEITPLFCERSNVKLPSDRIAKKIQHWQGVIISASEQSGRTIVPVLHQPIWLSDWVSQCEGASFICDFNPSDQLTHDFQQANLLIGPEGGLTPTEIELAYHYGFQSLHLGNLTLRTETAPIVAITKLTAA